MGSRRPTERSTSWNGRSGNGDDSSGSSRPGGCSYLSNVRPENRSTLCSVMAQLAEETQPSFETTLKSKAVCANCNVKFSCVVTGYPVPQVIWYKDDVQLDRYCGLPKYEIFRNGQSHSLHIYNCTVDDAAIYQASATNSKGIVSCSGVLEVGEMNEFKIHQRYFAKLKQKAEHRRKEVEGKENQEPLRTISPDRTQRKRRSTMEALLSTPSSMEDEGNEESHRALTVETEARLQEAPVEEVEEKPAPITNGAVSAITNGQVVHESANKGGTYIYDSAQRIFTAHQPKNPFVKKKIKISNSAKMAKADVQGERASEEIKAKDKTVSVTCTDSLQSKRNSEGVMEVKKIVSSSIVDSVSRNLTEQNDKTATEDAMLVERPSKDENVCAVPSQRDQLVVSASDTVPGTGSEQSAKHDMETGHKDGEENLEMQRQTPHINPNVISTQPQSSVASIVQSILKEDIIKTEDATAMDIDEKSDTSTSGSLARKDLKPVDTPCESRNALLLPPCEQTGDQLSEKETSPGQKNVCASRPVLLTEVTQAHTKMNRNEAPVNLELPPDPSPMDIQRRQKTSERKTMTDDIHTSSLHHGLQAAIDKMRQDTWDHSTGSNESHTVLFTDLQKSPLESPSGDETTRGCNISPTSQQSQVDTAIKTVEGTEIQADEEVELGKLLVQTGRIAPNKKIVETEIETETASLHMVGQTKTEMTRYAVKKECKEKNEPISKMPEECCSELQNLKPHVSETAVPLLTNTQENGNTLEQIIDFNEIPKPSSKVISIAELLRSQIKALELTLADSVPTMPVYAEFVQQPTTATEMCQESTENDKKCKVEVKTSVPDKKPETIINGSSPTNIKAAPMEVYHQLNKSDPEQIQTEGATLPPVQALQKPLVIPPIPVVNTGTIIETTGLHGSARKYNEGGKDTGQETGVSSLVPSIDCPVLSLTESENVGHKLLSSASMDKLTNRPTSISNVSGTVSRGSGTSIKASGEGSNITILEHGQGKPVQGKDMATIQKLSPEIKLNINTETAVTEINSTMLLDQGRMEEYNTNTSFLHRAQKFPTQSVVSTDTQENSPQFPQQDSSLFEEFSRGDYLTNPPLATSPLLRKRSCVSPIPSATPQELASGARRKIIVPKAKPEEATEVASPIDSQAPKKEVSTQISRLSTSPMTPSTSPSLSRRSPLLQPAGEQSPVERCSPLMSRRWTTSETQAPSQLSTEEIHTPKTEKSTEKDKHDPFKAPQVIRKIRGETFADASGHLKLWCQFFNVLSDSTIKWYKNEERIAQIKRNAGDETQVNLAIVQASSKDAGVYGCSITNEYGTDSTDTLLSADILAGMSLREDLGVGEEIEMTPLIFSKGVADSGAWGNKLFGRIMMQESHIGDGCSHKVWRAKVIYGLEPVFESGNTCIIKVRNPIAYGGKEESRLIETNLDIVKQECKIQNLAREYCKIFSAEARVIENFGPSLEVIPVYLMYRPANTVPYATVEADLTGVYQKYSVLDHTGRIDFRNGSGIEQKCCALQHWIFQWTNGNLLLTRLEGVDTKITNVGISVKSTGHLGLSVEGSPKVFEQFVSQHQCNYYCGLLGLRSLKVMDSLLTPTKPKGSRSPLLQRKMASGSSSPQTGRKAAGSPRLPRKAEQDGRNTPTKQKAADTLKVVKMA